MYTYKELLAEYKLVRDIADPWGSSMNLHFSICDQLNDRGEYTPASWGYKPSASIGTGDYWHQVLIDYDTSVLIEAGLILHRYESRLDNLGLSY